jgi:hypothetical protein
MSLTASQQLRTLLIGQVILMNAAFKILNTAIHQLFKDLNNLVDQYFLNDYDNDTAKSGTDNDPFTV